MQLPLAGRPPHDLIAEARVLKRRPSHRYGEVYVRSGEKIVAHATLNFLNTYPRRKTRAFDPAQDGSEAA